MARNTGMDDLFGHVPQKGDLALDDASPAVAVSSGPPVHTIDTIREMVEGLLQELETSETCPWNPRDLYGNRGMWRHWMHWFRNTGEAEDFTRRFHAALTRFGKPLVNPPFEEAWENGVFEETRATVEGREPDPRLLAPG
ncbi:MAG: hypothetical protein H2049_10820 [Porphyrobacter sp.]|nr:hypothetical protein [Porphyrobacter sp.]